MGVGGRIDEVIGEVITASERSACPTATFPSYVLAARNPRGAGTGAGVILWSTAALERW